MGESLNVVSFDETILDLVRRVEELLLRQATDPRQRLLVALAGVPGSGKSTVSNALISELGRRGVEGVAVVPMVSHDFFTVRDMLLRNVGWFPLHQGNSGYFSRRGGGFSETWCTVYLRREGIRGPRESIEVDACHHRRRLRSYHICTKFRSCNQRSCNGCYNNIVSYTISDRRRQLHIAGPRPMEEHCENMRREVMLLVLV
jgi:hypothetical protein